MLAGDAAREALAGFTASERDRSKGVRIKSLLAPKLAVAVVTALEGRRPGEDVARELDLAGRAKRVKALRALSPELGADLADWWEWSAGQPHQRDFDRRAYRSHDPADSRAGRWLDLQRLLQHSVTYPQPIAWQASWALHLHGLAPLGQLFASAMAHGNTEVASTLLASVRGEHEVSGPSRHAFAALLAAPDPAGWHEVERLLVAAQRAEGLRQAVLEAVDLAHPDAFERMLDLVVEHRLGRFAGTVRALSVWIGEEVGVREEKKVAAVLTLMRDALRRQPTLPELRDTDAMTAFVGLWAIAVRDVHAAIAVAEQLLDHEDQTLRTAAARLLSDVDVAGAAAGLERALRDPCLEVYASAVRAWPTHGSLTVPLSEAARTELWSRASTLGRAREIEIGVVGTLQQRIGGALAADVLVMQSGDRPVSRDVIAAASADGRWWAARRLAERPEANRAALFSMLVDRSTSVQEVVGGALVSLTSISTDEASQLEEALRSKASAVRTTALQLLRDQDPARLAASIERLAAGTKEQQRAAAELRGDAAAPTAATDVPAVVRFGVADRTPAVRPHAPRPELWRPLHPGFALVLSSLDAWLREHADVEVQTYDGVELLANVRWLGTGRDGALPLPEVIGPWWERIEPRLTDGGVELAVLTLLPAGRRRWTTKVARTVVGSGLPALHRDVERLVWQVVEVVADHARRPSWAETVVRHVEATAAGLPLDELVGPDEVLRRRGRRLQVDQWGNVQSEDARTAARDLFAGAPRFVDPGLLDDDQLDRLWRALRFVDEPEGTFDRWGGTQVEVTVPRGSRVGGTELVPDQPDRWQVPARILVEAFDRGLATRADLVDALVAMPNRPGRYLYGRRQTALPALTGLRPQPWAAGARVQAVVAEVRAAVVEAESARGDLPTALSLTAEGLRSVEGADQLVACLAALGRRPFTRAYAWTSSRESSLSHLVRVSQPRASDTAQVLGDLAGRAGVVDARLVETAVYAPQWCGLVEEHLGWRGLGSAVWWVHAHTKDDAWSVDEDVRAQWASEVSQRTPLDAVDLVGGAADVAWFREMVAELGLDRFRQVLRAAKYASSSGGHKRAELFAAALLDEVDEDELLTRIRTKRHQDSVRALGLLPVPDPAALLARYELLRAFVASDRSSGSQRRASETKAVSVGLENLARTAGFRDPQRLVWAMEAEAVRDLADGPVVARDGDLVVTLSIDAAGSPELAVERAGRALASVPAKSAKVPAVAELTARASSLRSQARRMRSSLESACVLGESFAPDEVAELLRHPVLAPMLRDLVLVDAEGRAGFPVDGATLVAADGSRVAATAPLRIAHPVDLLASGDWPALQHVVMSEGRKQPFKQLFRELYTLNENERDESGTRSRRYAGHQLEARRAGGIFTSRGWVSDVERGFSRTWHEHRITAWCDVLDGWGSPTEVEDATLETVSFHRAGTLSSVPLADVPPRVFSETMRDLDLVAAVAHSSGVDPGTSESSIEVRGRLVDETTSLLGMTNVEVAGHHARIKGSLGTYSVHLGSGVVHRVPGNAVCIVPVSAQHRGRIFLPFADDDPRTAEVVAKVVLLARDAKIKDPTILEQLVG